MASSETLRKLVLQLAGPHRDRSRLAKLLGITEATAYGWISLAEGETFGVATSVRGEPNRQAKARLEEICDEIESGRIDLEDAEARLRTKMPLPSTAIDPSIKGQGDDSTRRAALRRGLHYAAQQLDRGVSIDEVIASVRTILAMYDEGGPA